MRLPKQRQHWRDSVLVQGLAFLHDDLWISTRADYRMTSISAGRFLNGFLDKVRDVVRQIVLAQERVQLIDQFVLAEAYMKEAVRAKDILQEIEKLFAGAGQCVRDRVVRVRRQV